MRLAEGATTFSITALTITTFSIRTHRVHMASMMTLCINDTQHNVAFQMLG